MDQGDHDPRELERKIEQVTRIASRLNDQTTVERLWAWVEAATSAVQKALKPHDFPVNADGKKIKRQDGTPIANTDDPAVAADVAERLNEDEGRRRG